MALEFVGVAALGAAFGKLINALLEVKDKAINFKSILDRFESTLNLIEPIIRQIEILDRELNHPEKETKMFTDQLSEAAKLVLKCSKIKRWNFIKMASYWDKLKESEDSLVKLFQVYAQALQTRDKKKFQEKLNEICAKLDEMRNGRWFSAPNPFRAPGVPAFTVGLEEPLHQLKTRLLKDGVQVVVLSAPGGCGKTTLAKMLCHDAEIKENFKNIFFVTVSKTPNLKKLENLLNLNEIETTPKLLVLDDVWSESESLIRKFKFSIPGCKILVTSRFVLPAFGFTYKLKLLNDEDATILFRKSAFPDDGSPDISKDVVNKIVRGCRGFPLALTVVGRSLCGRPELLWERLLKQWSEEGQFICDSNNSNNELLNCLQTSVDALGEKSNVKECFLDLGSFPEDQRIPATTLIDIGVGLYNLKEDDVLDNIYELSFQNFANLVLTRKYVISHFQTEDHFVMQHDMLRELAIHQSSQEPVELRRRLIVEIRGNDLPKWWIEKMDRPFQARLLSIFTGLLSHIFHKQNLLLKWWIEKMDRPYQAHLLSISTDENFSSSWCNIQLPEIKVLILNFKSMNYSLPEFMEKMDQLKVLIIANYGFFPVKLSNFHLLGSLSGLKRIRLEKVSVSFLSESTLQFGNLQKLSLIMCEIGKAFTNCTINIPHMFPNLLEIDIDCCIDLVELLEGLCGLPCLKKLSITKCHDLEALPEGFGRLTSLEMLRLHACTSLLGLPESIRSLRKLAVLDISDCLSMTELPMGIGELCGLKKLDVRGCEFHKLPSSVKLEEVICSKEASDLWKPFKTHLPDLKIKALDEDINLDWLPNLRF